LLASVTDGSWHALEVNLSAYIEDRWW